MSQAQTLVDHALREAPPAAGLAFVLMVCVGLRRSEALALRWKDLWQEGPTWRMTVQGKGHRTRTVFVDEVMWTALRRSASLRSQRRASPDRYLITGPAGGPASRATIARWISAFGALVGRDDLTPHELRRTFATLSRDNGAALEDVQRTLGHSNPATTLDCYDTTGVRQPPSPGLRVASAAS